MAIALSGDARIYYEVHGSGPAVLFVHGSGGHHAAWGQPGAPLSPDYAVITVDLRGFGNSRWESDHDARNFPGDIIAVLDAVAADGGPDRAVLAGQSIGAAAALRGALGRADRPHGRVPDRGARHGVPVPADGHVQHRQDGRPAEPEQRRPHGGRAGHGPVPGA